MQVCLCWEGPKALGRPGPPGARAYTERKKKNQNSVHPKERLPMVQALGKTLPVAYLIYPLSRICYYLYSTEEESETQTVK